LKNLTFRKTQLEIDLRKLKKNFRALRSLAPSRSLVALLKSDAYGHSSVVVAKSLAKEKGLNGFAVANVEEGIELREAGLRGRVYVLSGIQSPNRKLILALDRFDLIPVVSSLQVLEQVSRLVRRKLRLHLKFNTGMNRLGLPEKETEAAIQILRSSKWLELEGLLSHFAASENPKKAITRRQVTVFRRIVSRFREAGFSPKYLHMENSFGLYNHVFPEGDFSRVGLHLYGEGEGLGGLVEPIARWTAQIYQIIDVARGEGIGYGPSYRTKHAAKIAILGVGYADGYPRILSNRAEVLVRGKRCKVVGSVSMDLMAVDITGVVGINLSTPVILLGKDRNERITAVELSKRAGTIPWEILTGISARVPRVFKA
jgi:alanine racemase